MNEHLQQSGRLSSAIISSPLRRQHLFVLVLIIIFDVERVLTHARLLVASFFVGKAFFIPPALYKGPRKPRPPQ